MVAFKSITPFTQRIVPSVRILRLVSDIRSMVNTAVDRALKDGITFRNKLSAAVYQDLRMQYPIPGYYHIEAINKAVA